MIALPRAWRGLLASELVRPGALSVVDQAMLSATSFFIGLILARSTAPGNFGAYSVAIAIMLVLGGVQAALVTTPLTILGAPREGDDLRRWVSALLAAQVALALVLTTLLAVASVVVSHASPDSRLPETLIGLTVAFLFVQTQEFCRRVFFLRLLATRVLLNDVVYCSLQVAGVATLWALDRRPLRSGGWLSGGNVFLAMAVSAMVGTAFGLWQAREFLTTRRHSEGRALLGEAWAMGRFNLGGQVGQAMLLFANRFVAAAFGGTVGVASLEAPRLLVAPLHVLGISAGNVTAPQAATAYVSGGRKALLGFLVPVAALWAVAFLGYAFVLAVAPTFWLRLLYGHKFDGAERILVVWCLCYAIVGLRVLPAIALRVTRHYSTIMWAGLGAGTASIFASVLLCAYCGVIGAAYGRLLGDIALLGALAIAFRRAIKLPQNRR